MKEVTRIERDWRGIEFGLFCVYSNLLQYRYCLKDALLPLELLDKLMAVINGIEQSRVTGVPIKWLLSRGQGVKTFSNILRYKEPWEVVPSKSAKSNTDFTSGGYVRDPVVGWYRYPLITLDFTSLYPSIMQAYNICYSTVESLAWARANMDPNDYWIPESPDGITQPDFCFVKKHVREGVLPKLLTSLLNQRAHVKNLMKTVNKVTQKLLYDVLDNRQLALKVVCNSVYGFLKAFILVDPRLMAAVTSYGRMMIIKTANYIEETYSAKNGFTIVDREKCIELGLDYERAPQPGEPDPRPRKLQDAKIIYGDTDSVMCDFGDIGLQEAIRLGKEAAAACTGLMIKPNKLDFESVKLRSLMMKKKKYAALEILAADVKPDDTMLTACERAKISFKGIESKRRDNAPIGSKTQKRVITCILKNDDVDAAVEVVKSTISDVLMDRVDMSQYIISKGLSKTEEQYDKNGSKQLHTELKKRIAARARYTGEVIPETGDRVPFIMKAGTAKETGKGASKTHELSEDPVYAQQHGVPINTSYYIKKQIMSATIRVFTCVWEPHKLKSISSNMTKDALSQLKVHRVLFKKDLPHMKKTKVAHVRTFGIASFAKVLPKCLHPGCNVRLTANGKSNLVCDSHEKQEAYDYVFNERMRREQANTKAWKTCIDCAGGGFDVVTCSNMVCENFFHRQRTLMDIEDIAKEDARFGEPDKVAPVGGVKRGIVIDNSHDPERQKRIWSLPKKTKRAAPGKRRK